MAAATLAGAQADAMKSSGFQLRPCAMTGFMGRGHGQSGWRSQYAEPLSRWGAQQQDSGSTEHTVPRCQPFAFLYGTWKCECGAENTGKFCAEDAVESRNLSLQTS